MYIFFLYLIILSIYEIKIILGNEKENKIKNIIIYFVMLILCVTVGMYYYKNKYGTSLAGHLFVLLNIRGD